MVLYEDLEVPQTQLSGHQRNKGAVSWRIDSEMYSFGTIVLVNATPLLLIFIKFAYRPLIKTLIEEIFPWLKNKIKNQWCKRQDD